MGPECSVFNKETPRFAIGNWHPYRTMTCCLGSVVLEPKILVSFCVQINEMWKRLRDLLKEPSQYQVDCQKPKPVLLSTGEMFVPYAWAVRPSFLKSCKLVGQIRTLSLFCLTPLHISAARYTPNSNSEVGEFCYLICAWRFAFS